MDALGREADTALLILSFLQADLRDQDLGAQLLSLAQDLDLDLGLGPHHALDDGCLETDGSGSGSRSGSRRLHPGLWGAAPSVELHRPDAAAVREVAEELRVLADRLDQGVVAQAAHNLRRNLLTSPSDKWEGHLSREVSRVLRHSVALGDVAQEGVAVALTLALVKGVCEYAPQLLRGLFSSTLHYLVHPRAK